MVLGLGLRGYLLLLKFLLSVGFHEGMYTTEPNRKSNSIQDARDVPQVLVPHSLKFRVWDLRLRVLSSMREKLK